MNRSTELETATKPQQRLTQSMAAPAAGGVLRINSAQLFAGAYEIEIDHNGTSYRLRHTASGKLILTK